MSPRAGPVLGIDFGTTYSSVGALVGGQVELVPDDGDPAIPSVVHLPLRGDAVVGRRAIPHLLSAPTATVTSVKRLLGHAADDAAVETLAAGVPYRVRGAGGHLVIATGGGREYACEQVAALILSRLRDAAEARFGGRATRVVMTIPAAASKGYVEALRRAAKLAHLEIAQVVAEPIAGALALGLHCEPSQRRLVVCDFGGGTFDVTAIAQDGLRFAPVATVGDPMLGGDDLDVAMANMIAGAIYRKARYDVLHDHVRRTQLVQRCESVKRSLSTALEARLILRDAYVDRAEYRSLDLPITRTQVEPVWRPLIDRATLCVRRALARARWTPDDVDQVVLIGGGSMVPLFQSEMATVIDPARISTTPLAGIAVAMGATLLTAPFATAGASIPSLAPGAAMLGTSTADDDGIPIDVG